MKNSITTRKVAETVIGAAIGGAIAGPAGAVAGGLVGSQVAAHTPHSAQDTPTTMKTTETDDPVLHAQLKRILVPVDFSPSSRRALRVAREWAVRFGSEVCLVHVNEPMDTYGVMGPDFIAPPAEPANLRETMHAELTKLACEEFPNAVKVSVQLHEGIAGDQIVATAREWKADLIIISTHGRTGLARVLMGSTAEQVVRHAPCPVLTVRRAAAE